MWELLRHGLGSAHDCGYGVVHFGIVQFYVLTALCNKSINHKHDWTTFSITVVVLKAWDTIDGERILFLFFYIYFYSSHFFPGTEIKIKSYNNKNSIWVPFKTRNEVWGYKSDFSKTIRKCTSVLYDCFECPTQMSKDFQHVSPLRD